MPLVLYGHRFSSYTQKALIALYENRTAHEFRALGPDDPEHVTQWLQHWPLRQFPVLVDGDRSFAETSIIIEYLQLVHPGPVRLLPTEPMVALEVRFLDRFFDLHVMTPVQAAVAGALTGDMNRQEEALAQAADRLVRAYAWIELHLAGKTWATGAEFSMADCAAAPALFYADWTFRIPDTYPALRSYRERLLARPSFAQIVDEARPYRSLFPLGAPARD